MVAFTVAAIAAFNLLYLGYALRDAETLLEANRLGASGRYAAAETLAEKVTRPPAHAAALATRARALWGQGLLRQASQVFAQAAALEPYDWVLHRDWARVLAQLNDRRAAARVMARALQLNPKLRLPEGFVQRPRPATDRPPNSS